MTPTDIARAICCPSGTCIRPEACDATARNVPVNIPLAAQAVHRLYCQRWREWSASREGGGDGR